MQTNKKYLSFTSVWFFAFLCFICISISLFIAILFSDSLSEDFFTIDGLAIPQYTSTNNEFNVISFNNDSIPKNQRQQFTKNFIKEYIVNRYTISGNKANMEQNLGYSSPDTINNGIMLKLPSYEFVDGKINWTNAYKDFLKNELPEINELIESNTTRSVRIISEPQKINDWWVINVEFIYRNPTTYSLSIAKKEKYEIRLNISSYGIKSPDDINKNFPAGSVFAIKIIDLQKRKL